MEKKAYVERIMAFITNQQTGRKEEGGATPVPPEPESWTIDGVTYYNRCVFDLEALKNAQQIVVLDVLTGETIQSTDFPNLYSYVSQPSGVFGVGLKCGQTDYGAPIGNVLFLGETIYYTSRAFTLVDTQEEVDSEDKICLPTCSAYYGFLSEDGKSFISYFNLKD